MELEKKDLEKLVLESMKLRLHKKEVEEGVLGGIKGVAGGVKKMYQLGSVKSDIEDALKKIEGDKDKLEKLKTRADSLDLQSSDKALYDKLTAAISGTPSTAAAPSISPATTPSVAPATGTSGGGLPSSSAGSRTGGGSFTATSPSAGTTRRRVSSTGVFEPSSAATASAGTPSPAEIPAPVSTKTPDVKSPEKAKEVEPKNGEERPETEVAPKLPDEKYKTKPEKKPIDTSATTGQRPQNKKAFQTALDTVYNNFEKAAKDEKVKEAAKDIYNKFTEQISKFSVTTGKITEVKKEIKLSSIVRDAIKELDDAQKKEITGFINDLSQLTINFGYGNEFAKDYVSVIVPAPEPAPEAPPKAGKKEVEPTTTPTPAPEIAASTPPEDAPAKEEPRNLGFEPATPENSGPSALNKQVLKTIGIDDEELLKYLSDLMDSHEDEYEIVENKASYVKKLIIQETKKVIELTKWMKEKGYEANKIKSVLQMLQKFPKGTLGKEMVTFGGDAQKVLSGDESPQQQVSGSVQPSTVDNGAAGPSVADAKVAALQADDVTVARAPVQKSKAKKVANIAKSSGKNITVANTTQPNAVAVTVPVSAPSEDDKSAIVAAASELGADKTEVESDVGTGPAAVVVPANNLAAAALTDPDVALKAAQGTESPTARKGKRGKAPQPSVPEPSTKQPPAPQPPVKEPKEEAANVITLKTPVEKREFKQKISEKINPIFDKYENLRIEDFRSSLASAFESGNPIPLEKIIFSLNGLFKREIEKLKLSEAIRGRKPKPTELKQDADLSPEQKRDLLLSFQQELINAFKELYAEYNGSERVETAPVKGKFAPPRRIQKDPSLYKKIKKGSDDSDGDEEEEEDEESDDKSIRYIEPTDDLADDEDEENINRRRRRKTDDTYDDGNKGDDEPEEASFKEVRESLQSEPMFILKEGVFVLNKKAL